jgi:hypothetical protein
MENNLIKMNGKFIGYFFIVLVFLAACKPAGVVCYAYKSDTYVTDTGRHILSASSTISYGDYLFEFKMQLNTDSVFEVHGNIRRLINESVKYDTIGVYLLANKQYIEFDTFAINSAIVKKGELADKPTGVRLGDGKQTINYTPPFISVPKDTIMNEIPCYYTEVLGDAAHPVSDTAGTRFILIKNRRLTSLYKVFGLGCMNNEYCIVGIHQYHKQRQVGYIQDIAGLRPLTTAEKQVCASMVAKAGLPPPK